ncbi:MAG: NAD(P)-dependent alcohol dehydrogenase [Bacteriovoracaceae bacterium]
MNTVKAYAAIDANSPLKFHPIERRDLRENDVEIDIKYCGVCHSDLHIARNEWGGTTYPIVPGHEIVGTVKSVGSKVTKFKVGDKVGVGCLVDSCQKCHCCHEGLEQFCENGMVGTYGGIDLIDQTPTQGGYSTSIKVREEFVLRIPDNLPLAEAAPLLCAGITTYSPLKHWKVGPGSKVAVIGLGGLGHMAVKIAKAMGGEVTVISQSLRKKEDGLRLGASHYYASSDENTFSQLANTFDLIINTVSAKLDLNPYLSLLRLDGAMVLLGIPPEAPTVMAQQLIFKRRSLSGSLIGGIKETQEMLDFCSKHDIVSDVEVIPMEYINEAYERMLKGDVKYRFVIDINSFEGM